LNPIEIADAYQKILDRYSLTQEELAKKMGKSRPLVANYLRLLNLPAEIKENVSRGTISMGHAKTLVGIEDSKIQLWLANEIISKNLSVRKLEELVQEIQNKRQKEKPAPKNRVKEPFYKAMEEKLREKFGTSVYIKPGKKKGKIEIEYFSQGDLERLLEMLD
jgi:ParB family chromosome partitioning protein